MKNKYDNYLSILGITTDYIVLVPTPKGSKKDILDREEPTLACEYWNMENKKYG